MTHGRSVLEYIIRYHIQDFLYAGIFSRTLELPEPSKRRKDAQMIGHSCCMPSLLDADECYG